MKYYSVIGKKEVWGGREILSFVIAWVDLEGIMLSAISQIQTGKYCMISLTCGVEKGLES